MMGVTRSRDLAAAAVVVAIVTYLFARLVYRHFPPISSWTGLSLAVLALVEVVWAASVRRRIRDGRIGVGAGRLDPLAVARSVAAAKASAWVGALAFGWWVGLLAYVVPRRAELRVAAADAPGIAVAAVSALLLVAAAQWLQYSCRSPRDPTAGSTAPD